MHWRLCDKYNDALLRIVSRTIGSYQDPWKCICTSNCEIQREQYWISYNAWDPDREEVEIFLNKILFVHQFYIGIDSFLNKLLVLEYTVHMKVTPFALKIETTHKHHIALVNWWLILWTTSWMHRSSFAAIYDLELQRERCLAVQQPPRP